MLALYLTLVDLPEDKEFLEYVYEEYRQFMFITAKDILRDDDEAEDAVHEAFLRLIAVIEKLRRYDKDHLQASVLITVRNVAINMLHKRKNLEYVGIFNEETEKILKTEDGKEFVTTINDEIELNEVLECIRRLKADEQDLLYMHFVHGTPGKELAKMFGISPAALRKRVERTRKKISKIYGGEEQ